MEISAIKPESKQTLYQLASLHSRAAIKRLAELIESNNENVALGACKALLNKVIPDLKSEKIESEDKEIRVIIEDYGNKKITP